MKDRTLIYLSLALSMTAFAYAAWVHQHAARMAIEVLHNRELELITHYAPKVREFYSGLTGHTNAYTSDPKTLEELLRPITDTMNRVGGTEDGSPTNAPPK